MSQTRVDPAFNGERCDDCRADLYGSLVIGSGSLGNFGVVAVTESGKRNWILCDGCNALLCHDCARRFQTGYCDDCIRNLNLKFDEEGALL